MPDKSGLVTTTVLDTNIGEVENKILNASGLAMKTDYGAKISGNDGKYLTTFDYDKVTK